MHLVMSIILLLSLSLSQALAYNFTFTYPRARALNLVILCSLARNDYIFCAPWRLQLY